VSREPGKKRPNRREVAAAETRREILRAARQLFSQYGYANTSVQQIAEESGVAVQTIYSSIGSKAALLLALNDLIDEEAGVAQLAAQLSTVTDPAQLIARAVHLTRQLNERCGDLIRVLLSAEPAEPDVAAVVADGMRRHERGAVTLACQLGTLGALPTDMTPQRAADVFSMMTSSASWRPHPPAGDNSPRMPTGASTTAKPGSPRLSRNFSYNNSRGAHNHDNRSTSASARIGDRGAAGLHAGCEGRKLLKLIERGSAGQFRPIAAGPDRSVNLTWQAVMAIGVRSPAAHHRLGGITDRPWAHPGFRTSAS
jgi:AcrR family transcriptional regulator